MSKLKKIIDIAAQAKSNKISIITDSFKAEGTLFDDKAKIEQGIVSLKDAEVSSLFGFCHCEDECTCSPDKYEWFNIFEEHIVAFTILK